MGSCIQLIVSFFLFTNLLCPFNSAQTFGVGDCPNLTPTKYFYYKQFVGNFYVTHRLESNPNSCLKYTFLGGEAEPGKVRKIQAILPYKLDDVGEFELVYSGVLTPLSSKIEEAKMQVKYLLNGVVQSASIWFGGEDVLTYGIVYTCHSFLNGHIKSLSILSRTPTVDKETLDLVHKKLKKEGIDPKTLKAVNHTKCDFTETRKKIDDKTVLAGAGSVGNGDGTVYGFSVENGNQTISEYVDTVNKAYQESFPFATGLQPPLV